VKLEAPIERRRRDFEVTLKHMPESRRAAAIFVFDERLKLPAFQHPGVFRMLIPYFVV
jgi:hypothetical protein